MQNMFTSMSCLLAADFTAMSHACHLKPPHPLYSAYDANVMGCGYYW